MSLLFNTLSRFVIAFLPRNRHLLISWLQSLSTVILETKKIKSATVSTSVQFSHSVVSDSLRPNGLQHTRPACPSPTSGVYSNSCPLSPWCHPTISSCFPFSFCLQSFPTLVSFLTSQLFASGGQRKYWGFSFSICPFNKYSGLISFRTDWFDLLQSNRLSRVFSNTTVQKHQFFGT